MSSSHVFDFTDVFRAEIAVINARRASQDRSRAPVVLAEEATDSAETRSSPQCDANLVVWRYRGEECDRQRSVSARCRD
jgi:hypothetical protein